MQLMKAKQKEMTMHFNTSYVPFNPKVESVLEELINVKRELINLRNSICPKVNVPKFSKMTFGEALEAIKSGKKVTRQCWNNLNVFVYYWNGAGLTNDDGSLPELRVKTIQQKHAPWMPNHQELLAEDWKVVV